MTEAGPADVPLTGADCFLRAFDDEIRRWNGASHVSELVLRLGPGFDAEAFRELVARGAETTPILTAPIGRRAGVGAPVFRVSRAAGRPAPAVRVHAASEARVDGRGDGPIPEAFFGALNQPFDGGRGELLRFDVVPRADGGTDLAMSWLHMLLDGSGSEKLVRRLDEVHRGARDIADLGAPDPTPAPKYADGPGAAQRGRMATAWQRRFESFGAHPIRSLAGPLARVPQDLSFAARAMNAADTASIRAAASRRAGFLTPMLFYLAASIRAHHAVLADRGAAPASYVVPLPVNLRPPGTEGEVFGTHVSLLWFQVRRETVEDLDALLAELKAQRHDSIKEGLVEAGAAALDFARFAPRRVYARMARRTFRGELCSFFFAYTGDFLAGMESFCGAPLLNGYHAPAVPASPGSCIAFSLRPERLNISHVFQRGAVTDAERERFEEALMADLLGGA